MISSSTASATTTLFSISNTGALTQGGNASSTFSNGINLTSGCFSVAGTCIGGTGGGGSGTVSSGTQGQFAFYNANGTTVSGTSTLFVTQAGQIGIGTTTPNAKLSIFANLGETNTTLFNIASTTGNATTTLFSISNTGLTTIASNLNVQGGFIDLSSNSSGGSGITSAGGHLLFNSNGSNPGAALYFGADFNVAGTGGTLGFSATGFPVNSAPDAAFSHLANSTIALGNGTAGDYSGTLIAGQIGIGTTTPDAYLTIFAPRGGTNATLFDIASSTGSVTTTLFSIANTGTQNFNLDSSTTTLATFCWTDV